MRRCPHLETFLSMFVNGQADKTANCSDPTDIAVVFAEGQDVWSL